MVGFGGVGGGVSGVVGGGRNAAVAGCDVISQFW